MPGQEARRLPHSDPGRHREQLRPLHGPGDADHDTGRAAHPGVVYVRSTCPAPAVQAEVAHDVRGVLALVPHGLDGDVVVDERVTLGIAGDTDPGEGPAQLGQPTHHRQRSGVGPGRRVGVTGRDEDVVHTGRTEPVDDLPQVGVVPQQPRRHVRDDPVAVSREPAGESEGRLQAPDRRRRHRHDDIARDMRENLVLGRLRGQHLVADAVQQRPQPCGTQRLPVLLLCVTVAVVRGLRRRERLLAEDQVGGLLGDHHHRRRCRW
ncbi:hypothetical protein SVIOM74S_09855 [Streptomyces violarus]